MAAKYNDKFVSDFWAKKQAVVSVWTISTEIVSIGNTVNACYRASILEDGRLRATAHSDSCNAGDLKSIYEVEAIRRAIELLGD